MHLEPQKTGIEAGTELGGWEAMCCPGGRPWEGVW